MKRRDVLVGAGALALAAVAKAAPQKSEGKSGAMSALVDAAADCLKRGEACQQHCLQMLTSGDTSMGACGMAVRDMLASVRALLTLAAAGSSHTKLVAAACATICKDCETECRKHPTMSVCKECGDACARMQAEIAKL